MGKSFVCFVQVLYKNGYLWRYQSKHEAGRCIASHRISSSFIWRSRVSIFYVLARQSELLLVSTYARKNAIFFPLVVCFALSLFILFTTSTIYSVCLIVFLFYRSLWAPVVIEYCLLNKPTGSDECSSASRQKQKNHDSILLFLRWVYLFLSLLIGFPHVWMLRLKYNSSCIPIPFYYSFAMNDSVMNK